MAWPIGRPFRLRRLLAEWKGCTLGNQTHLSLRAHLWHLDAAGAWWVSESLIICEDGMNRMGLCTWNPQWLAPSRSSRLCSFPLSFLFSTLVYNYWCMEWTRCQKTYFTNYLTRDLVTKVFKWLLVWFFFNVAICLYHATFAKMIGDSFSNKINVLSSIKW